MRIYPQTYPEGFMVTICFLKSDSMKIIINGRPNHLETSANLKKLVEQLCKNSSHVIAELNGTIVKNQDWEKHHLKDGDMLELVNFVGGG